MSWLVNSIASSLILDDDDDEDNNDNNNNNNNIQSKPTTTGDLQNPNNDNIETNPQLPRGVKEDLTEISKTLTRQFWGVASFLAPPPNRDQDPQPDDDDPARITGIRNDLSEIGGKFRAGVSKLSSNKAVSEFTKIATNLLQFASEDGLTIEDYAQRGVVGVTEGVVTFARDIALHPETWLDFPLPDDDDDDQDFDLSDAQQEHALAVERLAPELAALRTELCLGYMSEACFWKIYFVLVHPRLSRHDAEILSTPEIVRARAMLTLESHSGGKPKPYEAGAGSTCADTTNLSHENELSVPVMEQSDSVPVEISAVEPASSIEADSEMDKHPVISTEIQVIDKKVIEEVPMKQTSIEKPTASTSKSVVQNDDKKVVEEVPMKQTSIEKPTASTSKSVVQNDDNDADDWLQEDNTEATSFKGSSYLLGNDDDDISFSDLEEDEDVPASSKKVGHPNDKVSSETLKNKESNDWLDVEDIDIA